MYVRPRNPRRAAFTLVEMLVAAALCMFVMSIIAYAFQKGMDTFSKLHSAGNLQEKLRAAAMLLRRDLQTQHFGDKAHPWDGPNLRDQRLDDPDWLPPNEGFFRIWQGTGINPLLTGTHPDAVSPPTQMQAYVHENGVFNPGAMTGPGGIWNTPTYDLSTGVPSYRATNQMLHFTSRLSAVGPNEIYSVERRGIVPPGNIFTDPYHLNDPSRLFSRWAEIGWFVEPSGDTAGNTQLYVLRRRLALLLDTQDASGISFVNHPFVSQSYGRYNTPRTVTRPEARRFNAENSSLPSVNQILPPFLDNLNFGNLRLFNIEQVSVDNRGDDIVLHNVISFEIKATGQPNTTLYPNVNVPPDPIMVGNGLGTNPIPVWPRPVLMPNPYQTGTYIANPDYPFDDLPSAVLTGAFRTQGINPRFRGHRVFDTWCKDSNVAPWTNANDYSGNGLPPGNYRWDPLDAGPTNNGFPAGVPQNSYIPSRIRITALKITIRIWDDAAKQARQMTFIQDM